MSYSHTAEQTLCAVSAEQVPNHEEGGRMMFTSRDS